MKIETIVYPQIHQDCGVRATIPGDHRGTGWCKRIMAATSRSELVTVLTDERNRLNREGTDELAGHMEEAFTKLLEYLNPGKNPPQITIIEVRVRREF